MKAHPGRECPRTTNAARTGLLLSGLLASAAVSAADVNAGQALFRAQCALCHSAAPGDDGGGQGPSLEHVLGRRAASSPGFQYTDALRDSGLTWDAATLERFLAAPASVVPGSAMVTAVPAAQDRGNLIAYLEALEAGTFTGSPPPEPGARPPIAAAAGAAAATRAGVAADGLAPAGEPDWRKDFPGRVHRFDAAQLPPPYRTPSASNRVELVDRPAAAQLLVPPRFHVGVFAQELRGPRALRVAPNGDVIASETRAGRVLVLRPTADGASAATIEVFAQDLSLPFGIALYPDGPEPRWLYVAETNRVVRYPYRTGDLKARAVPEIVVPELTPAGGGHSTRDLVFSPDGTRLFVSVGSASNVAERMERKSPQDIKAWEAAQGLGAAWGNETNRAAVLEFEVGSARAGRIYASGLRNCVGLTVQPASGELWCTVNERDGLGDDLPPDYSTRVRAGGFYGWPWYYLGTHEDPRRKGERADLAGKVIVPDVLYQSHSAPLNLVFYTATAGAAAYPKEYLGDGFAVLHGSWNRAQRTGYKVVRLPMRHGVPTGEYQDFLVGFISDDAHAWGRPVGAAVARDGALLVSDDGGNLIWRIAYAP